MLVPLTLSLALFATPALPSDPAELLPADSLVYFGTDSLMEGAKASQNTSMAKIMGESEVRAFMHKPTAAAEIVLNGMLQMASAEMGEGGSVPSDLKLDLSPSDSAILNMGRAFFALTHLAMPTSPDNPVPDVGLVLGVEIFDASQVEVLKGLWSALPAEEADGNYNGVDYSAKMIPNAPVSVHLAFLGDLAVLSLSAESLHGVIDRFQGKAPEGSSLAASADYLNMMGAAGGSVSGGTINFVRVGPLMTFAQQFILMASAQAEDPASIRSLVTGLFEGLGLDAVRLAGGTSAIGKDGLIHTTSVAWIDSSASGLIPSLVKSGGTIERGLLNDVPGDALGASIWTMGDELVSVYDFLMNAVGSIDPAERAEVEGMLTEMLGGASLRDDLLGNLHGDSTYYSVPGHGFTGAPESVFRSSIRDGDGLVKVMEAIARAVTEQAGMPVSLKSSEHEGAMLYELDISATPVAAVMQPSFSIRNDKLLFSNQLSQLKSVLNGERGDGESLGRNPGLSDFLDGLGKGAELQSVKYADNAANFQSVYGPIAGFLPMIAGMAGNIPVDFAKLPPEQAIAQHLGPTYAARYTDSNGFIVDQSISQFQTSDFMPILLVAGLVALGQQEGIDVSSSMVEVIDPEKQAQLDLRELKAACTVYKISTGGYPESLEALLAPLPDYEDGALPRDALPVDPWGKGYFFALEVPAGKRKPKPKLWSAGPNGIDENGEGDDVLKF
jgi:hypothetical protein